MKKKSIEKIMSTSPQIWTVSSILNHNFGEILFYDDNRVCLKLTCFYFIEGPFLESFGQKLLPYIRLPIFIVSSNKDWYDYFSTNSKIPLEFMIRRMYRWSGKVDQLTPYLTHVVNPDYEIKMIGRKEAEQIGSFEWSEGAFDSYQDIDNFLAHGFGYCILYQGQIVSLCLSFAQSEYGAEIEVDTDPNHQRQGLGKIVAAHFVSESLRRNIQPLWESTNNASDKLAEAIGFEFTKQYEALVKNYD